VLRARLFSRVIIAAFNLATYRGEQGFAGSSIARASGGRSSQPSARRRFEHAI